MEVAAAYREPSMLGRKRASGTCGTKTILDAVGNMPDTEIVRQRFRSELVTARALLDKAVAALSSPSSPIPATRVEVEHSRRRGGFLGSEEPPAAKKIKASPVTVIIKRKKMMSDGERERLKGDLEKLAPELPDHIIELLKKQSRGISSAGEVEIDFNFVQDEALLELRQQLDEFVRQEHQEEEEEEEDVDIVGGVSPLATAPVPLQLVEEDEEEEEEYVDICGDASPVVISRKLGDSPCSSIDGPSRAEQDAELIIRASKERLERSKAREKARQEVLETERTAMPDDTIHPTVLQSLGIGDQYNRYNKLRSLGLFLKPDDGGIDDEQQHQQSFQEEDLEEGEIRQ